MHSCYTDDYSKPLPVAERIENETGQINAQERYLRRELHISDSEIPQAVAYLSKHPEIVRGDFYFGHRSYPFMTALISLNTFKDLTFFAPGYLQSAEQKEEIPFLLEAIEKTTKLEKLCLPALTEDKMALFTNAIKNNKSLHEVSLTLAEEKQEKSAYAIGKDIFQNNPRIKCFSLHAKNKVDEKTILVLLDLLKTNTTLEELRLYDIKSLSDATVLALVKATNQRTKPIKLAMYHKIEFTPAQEKILLQSKNITFLEAHILTVTPALKSHFNENAARHAAQEAFLTIAKVSNIGVVDKKENVPVVSKPSVAAVTPVATKPVVTPAVLPLSDSSSVVQAVKEKSIIQQVIDEASKTFVSGYMFNSNVKAQFATDPNLKAKYRSAAARFLSSPDEYFADYDATRIEGTMFVASKGPQNTFELASFFKSTAYNSQFPIKEVIALGLVLGRYDNTGFKDFYDYCAGSLTQLKCGPYHATVEKISGEFSTNYGGSNDQCYPHGIIRSKLSITDTDSKTTKQLNVTLYTLMDNTPIDFDQFEVDGWSKFVPAAATERKEIMWQLYQKSLNESVLIHCASGVGRTGHLILTFEILKHYDKIFANNNPIMIAAEIHKVLTRIRTNRPALVATGEQFAAAIKNADILHSYALEKKYITENVSAVDAKFSRARMFASAAKSDSSASIEMTTVPTYVVKK